MVITRESFSRSKKMKVVVTGAAGFIGHHVIKVLLDHGHAVTAVDINEAKARQYPWFRDLDSFITCDLYKETYHPNLEKQYDALMHLAWAGLPNYSELFHLEQNLPADYRFIKKMVSAGTRHILVTGTCYEYGLQNGCLSESSPTFPMNPYAIAKDTLRKELEMLKTKDPFTLQWARLFFLYGEGQSPKSLLSLLDTALEKGEKSFNMSGGEQLRDYLPVEGVASRLVALVEHPELQGIVNICSGKPISVRRLVEDHLKQRGKQIALNLGYYPYPTHEPMAFWGSSTKIDSILK
jgi:nucleoside-diphosphate-sugar epimerase